MPPVPKRQHQVSRGYLNRFGTDESVLVRRRDGKVFETSTLNVAVESGFYDLPDGRGGKSSAVELMLANLDGIAADVLKGIDLDGAPPSGGTEARRALAVVLAFQLSRTTEKREVMLFAGRVSDYAGSREISHELVAEYLEHEHLGFPPRKNEAEAAWIYVTKWLEDMPLGEKEFAIGMMLQTVELFVPRLLALYWSVEVDQKSGSSLLTCRSSCGERRRGATRSRDSGSTTRRSCDFPSTLRNSSSYRVRHARLACGSPASGYTPATATWPMDVTASSSGDEASEPSSRRSVLLLVDPSCAS
jgi:hypothetical protein